MDTWLSTITDATLETLPIPQREAVRLARDQQLTEAEIADQLGIPQGIVASRLFRARMMLDTKPKSASKATSKKAKAKTATAGDAGPLPTLAQVTKELEGLREVQKMLDADEASLPTLDEVKKDLEGLRSLQAMLDAAANEPEGQAPVNDVATVRARIEEVVPGYMAAVQAAEQQLQQAKARLAIA